MSYVVVDDGGVLQVRGSVVNVVELGELIEKLQHKLNSNYFQVPTKETDSGRPAASPDLHSVSAEHADAGSPGGVNANETIEAATQTEGNGGQPAG